MTATQTENWIDLDPREGKGVEPHAAADRGLALLAPAAERGSWADDR